MHNVVRMIQKKNRHEHKSKIAVKQNTKLEVRYIGRLTIEAHA